MVWKAILGGRCLDLTRILHFSREYFVVVCVFMSCPRQGTQQDWLMDQKLFRF
jgi:hypothetical protein